MDKSPYEISPAAEKRSSTSDEKRDPESGSISQDKRPLQDKSHVIAHDDEEDEQARERRNALYHKYRPFILGAVALVILGWWISATVLKATRHRWIVQTFWAWSFILLIAFRFIPNSVITKPVSAVWQPLIFKPFFSLSYRVRLGMGWLALLGIVFGSAFGFPLPEGTSYGDRAISVFGLFVFTTGFWLSSKHRSQVPWPTVIVGLFMQQAIALFVLKTDAGYKIFLWVARLAADFLGQATPAAGFFFDPEVTAKHWFFVSVLGAIIFFIAFIQMLYYLGVMQWLVKKFAWFFFKTMNVSGAEAVVAAASPWVGLGESACLVRPFVDLMTKSELHLIMTSGFSTISGSVFAAYVGMGVPGQNLVTSSVMSIPASIAISKLRIPETEEPLTRGQVTVDRGAEDKRNQPANALHAFSKGAVFGLIVAGQILCNVLTVLALVYTIDGFLTWIGKGFGIHELTLDLIFGYLFYPLTFLIGVPRGELLRVARLLAMKLVANEFVAYQTLRDQHAADPFSPRAYTIASYGLCGFANLGALGITIGVLSALAPSRGKIIARVAPSAMICGFLSTLQTAGIVVDIKIHPDARMEELENAGNQLHAALDEYLRVCSRIDGLVCRDGIPRNLPPTYLSHMDTAITRFHSYHTKLRQAEATIYRIRNHSSKLSPIASLPPEILTYIFHLVAKPCDLLAIEPEDPDEETSSSSEDSDGDLEKYYRNSKLDSFSTHLDQLTHVCSHWRQIAIASPSLWTHIDLIPHKTLHEQLLARAETYATRSSGLPIELHVSDISPLAYDRPGLSNFLSSILDRIESLDFVVLYTWRRFHDVVLSGIFSRGTSQPSALIKIKASFTTANDKVDEFVNYFHKTSRNHLCFTILHLRGLFPEWHNTAYHNLVDLRLVAPRAKRWTEIPERSLRNILSSSPGLCIFHFALHITDRQPDNTSVIPVSLNDLEVLNITTERGNEYPVLRPEHVLRLIAPGSKSLRLSIRRSYLEPACDYGIFPLREHLTFFRRSKVTKFCVTAPCPWLDQFLQYAPNLEDLAFDVDNLELQSTEWLKSGSPLASRLNSLTLFNRPPKLGHLELLLQKFPADLLFLNECKGYFCPGQTLFGQVLKLLEKYPGTKLVMRPSNAIADWSLID